MVPFQRPVISWQKANMGLHSTTIMKVTGFIGLDFEGNYGYLTENLLIYLKTTIFFTFTFSFIQNQ
jgi:hypothetical protein